jgi:hypothetical protein
MIKTTFNLMTKFLICMILLFMLTSCSKIMDYEITEIDQNRIEVNIPRRTTPDTLYMLADEIKKKGDSLNGLTIAFIIPSEYPHKLPQYPPPPWALFHYYLLESDDEIKTTLSIYGSYSDKHKENMMSIQAEGDSLIGKWYLNDPLKESVVIIEKLGSGIIMKSFYIPDYIELDGEPNDFEWSEMEGVFLPNTLNKYEPSVDYLKIGNAPNEFVTENGKWEVVYRILETGELIRGDSELRYTPIK